MIVLSLFNGMNTGRQALENLGFKIDKYYSSELKPYAIELTQFHFSDTIQLGDVTRWREWDIDWSKVDLILSGSPCQDLSAAGGRAGINGKKSSLFWVFIDILNHCKSLNPNVLFLQENVGSAPKKDVGIMSRALGLYPVQINSSLVVAALRDRLYWTNIRTKETMFDIVTDIPQPKDRKIMFKDILTDGFTDRKKAGSLLASDNKHLINDEKKQEIYINSRIKKGKQIPNIIYLNEYKKGTDKETHQLNPSKESGSQQPYMQNRVYSDKYKAPCLTESAASKLLVFTNNELRVKTNTVKGFDIVTQEDCLNLSFPNSTTRRGRVTKGKAPCLIESNEPLYAFDGIKIRTLNKTELCRLQGFPDDYCDILTRNKAASLLGDGWTLPVIEHIFSFINLK